MDDDYEISLSSNILSTKTSAVKHINNNDTTLVNHNTMNTSFKRMTKDALILPSSTNQQGIDTNIFLSAGNSNMINFNTDTNSSEELQSRLAFTSQKMLNGRNGIGNSIAVDCFETDTIDELMIKEEPLSPDSSCPPSPNASASSSANILVTQSTPQNVTSQFGTINVNLSNVATYTNADLVFEHSKVCFIQYTF